MRQAQIDDALAELNRRISKGEEFPDACWSVSCAFGVPVDVLRAAYDDQHGTTSSYASWGDSWDDF